jgi:hypothetical protein
MMACLSRHQQRIVKRPGLPGDEIGRRLRSRPRGPQSEPKLEAGGEVVDFADQLLGGGMATGFGGSNHSRQID